jgi:ABC-type nitrate/sulfonate/bicarbonate transport system permease component
MLPDLRVLAFCACAAWIAGLAVSWTLAILHSRRIDLSLKFLAQLAYRVTPGSDIISLGHLLVFVVLLATRARCEEIDRAYGNAARSLGASELRLAARLLPLAWPAILLSLVLALLGVYAVIAI